MGAFLFWSIGVKGIGAARASVFLNLIPVFTAVIAALALDERPGLPQLVGGLLVICGVTRPQFKVIRDGGLLDLLGVENFAPDLDFAIARAMNIVAET